ncbi:hypothetical protein GCM10028807_36460 [Spirosoma daeguense]
MVFYQNRLQVVINQEGITQAEIHGAANVNQATINRICRGGNSRPSEATIGKIVNGLNSHIEKRTGKKDKYKRDYIFVRVYNPEPNTEVVITTL